MRINAVCLVLFFAACTEHQQDEHETDHAAEGAVQQQESSYQANPPASKPAKPSAGAQQSSSPSKPPAKPSAGQQPSAPEPPVTQPDQQQEGTDSASTEETPPAGTDEEVMEGCGPMGGECIEDADCQPPFSEKLPWVDYHCLQEVGICEAAPAEISFLTNPAAGFTPELFDKYVPGSTTCIEIWRLSGDGAWKLELHEVPYSEPLQSVCASLESDAFVKPGAQLFSHRFHFRYVQCTVATSQVHAMQYIKHAKAALSTGSVMYSYPVASIEESIHGIPVGGIYGYLPDLGSICSFLSGNKDIWAYAPE